VEHDLVSPEKEGEEVLRRHVGGGAGMEASLCSEGGAEGVGEGLGVIFACVDVDEGEGFVGVDGDGGEGWSHGLMDGWSDGVVEWWSFGGKIVS
jgi:hypothetical protein